LTATLTPRTLDAVGVPTSELTFTCVLEPVEL
jgi:hypothetical protein